MSVQPFFPAFPNLPKDAINVILSYVHPIDVVLNKKVSKTWQSICGELSAKTMELVHEHSRQMGYHSIASNSADSPINDEIIKKLITKCFASAHFDISNQDGEPIGLTDASLLAITKDCRLTSFQLTSTNHPGFTQVTERGLLQFFQQNPSLNQINFMGVDHIANWNDLVSQLSKLKSICLSSPRLDRDLVTTVSQKFPNLYSLTLSFGYREDCPLTIDDQIINQLTLSHPKLKYLTLHGCRTVTPQVIDSIQKNCPQIQLLSLRHVPQAFHEQFNEKKLGDMEIKTESI